MHWLPETLYPLLQFNKNKLELYTSAPSGISSRHPGELISLYLLVEENDLQKLH